MNWRLASLVSAAILWIMAILGLALIPWVTFGAAIVVPISPPRVPQAHHPLPPPKPQTCVVQRCGLEKGVLINCEPVEIMNSQELAKLIQATTGGAVKWECGR